MTNPPICDYEGSDYQESFWGGGQRDYEDLAEVGALKKLLPSSGGLLLELGAGAGRNTPRYTGFEHIVLLDYSRTQLQQARSHLGPAHTYVAADIQHMPFVDGLFDIATMIRTLHHLVDAPLALKKVRQVLKPGGIFILEYANKHNLKAMLRYLLRRQSWSPYSLEPVEFEPLNFDFHPRAIRTWLKESGFHMQRQLTVSHFRVGWLKRHLPASFLAELDGLASMTGGWWQVSPSVFTISQADASGSLAPAGVFFKCPACDHAPLVETDTSFNCTNCSRRWPIRDGIFDFKEAF